MQQILAKLYDADRTVRQAAADGLDQGPAGQRPPADVHLQQPRPRPPDRLRAAALRRPDGAAPPGQRDQRRRGRRPDDRGRAASRHGPALLPPQGASCSAWSRSTTTTATPRSSPTCRRATGRRPGRSCRRATQAFSPQAGGDHPRVLRQALDRRRAAARQARRRLQQQRRAERPSVHPDELHRQAARRDDAGPRAGPRPAPVPVAAGRLSCSATRR